MGHFYLVYSEAMGHNDYVYYSRHKYEAGTRVYVPHAVPQSMYGSAADKGTIQEEISEADVAGKYGLDLGKILGLLKISEEEYNDDNFRLSMKQLVKRIKENERK